MVRKLSQHRGKLTGVCVGTALLATTLVAPDRLAALGQWARNTLSVAEDNRDARVHRPTSGASADRGITTEVQRALQETASATVIGHLNLDAVVPATAQPILLNPATVLPRAFDFPLAELRRLHSYSKSCETNATPKTSAQAQDTTRDGLQKAWTWQKHKCTGEPLPADFFATAPYIHPLGSSYAWRSLQLDSSSPIASRLAGLHISEIRRLLDDPTFKVLVPITQRVELEFLGQLDDAALTGLLNDAPVVIGPKLVGILQSSLMKTGSAMNSGEGTRPVWSILSRRQFDSMLESRELAVTTIAEGARCNWIDRGVCWKRIGDPGMEHLALVGVIAVACFLSGVLIDIRRRTALTRKAADAERTFLLNTLTHELRTPISVLRLTLENMRGEFDRWTESTQVGFLRMCDETARLARVMERSEQLARASQLRGQQQLGSGILRVPVSSIRDLCLDALAREGLPEGCLSPGPDVGLTTDPFWLGVCVQNLLRNAKVHGQAPVRIELSTTTAGRLIITVSDAGELRATVLPQGNGLLPQSEKTASMPDSQARGMGFGLHLVSAATVAMGGRLTASQRPTRFQLELPT
jgi:signal transduction histidine kinase